MTGQALDFAWPAGLLGRSSGWSQSRSAEGTMVHPPITLRRPVGLAPRWRALRIAVGADGRPDTGRLEPSTMLIKLNPGPGLLPGLSSGASSALMRLDSGEVVRIKRCGFATLGVGKRNGYVGRVGLMGVSEALQESRMLATFRAQGLCPACEPLSIELLADPSVPFFHEHACAAVRIRIESDVRADEWLLRLIAEGLRAAGVPGPFLRVAADERVSLVRAQEAAPALATGQIQEQAAQLGRALGGLLRAVHDTGLLRGRGSVWMGNDIVGSDGRLSAVDADGGAQSGAESLGLMRRIEAAEYAAGFADCFSWGQPDWLAEIATVLTEGFWEGYRAAARPMVAVGPAGKAPAG